MLGAKQFDHKFFINAPYRQNSEDFDIRSRRLKLPEVLPTDRPRQSIRMGKDKSLSR